MDEKKVISVEFEFHELVSTIQAASFALDSMLPSGKLMSTAEHEASASLSMLLCKLSDRLAKELS